MTDRKTERTSDKSKFVHYKSGAQMYDMCQTNFERLAKEAGATYKTNKLVLVNLEILDNYLEIFQFHIYSKRIK